MISGKIFILTNESKHSAIYIFTHFKTSRFVKPFFFSSVGHKGAPDPLLSGITCTASSIPSDVDMPAVEDKETYSSCQMSVTELADVRQYMVHTDTHYPYSGCSESLSVSSQIKGDTGRRQTTWVNTCLPWFF